MARTNIRSAQVLDSSLTNADISSSAAIAYSKLNLSASIVNADVATGAAIVSSKLSLTAITSFGLRDTSAAFDVTLAAVSSVTLTTGRTLTLDVQNAARTISLAGNLTLANAFITSGNNSLTLTTTATTNVTLPTTGTLATLAGTETLSGKTLTSPILRGAGTATLTDGATPALDASLGNVFLLTAAGDRTIAVPSNATGGQKIIIVHKASGADRTLSLNSGAGGFRFGTDITALTATTSALTDYIGCVYNAADSKWDVVAYTKGY